MVSRMESQRAYRELLQPPRRLSYDAALKICWDSESNMRRAINAALNKAVPRTFRRVPGGLVGLQTFRPTDDSKVILNHLRTNYGRMTPLEKTALEKTMVSRMEFQRAHRELLRPPRRLLHDGNHAATGVHVRTDD